MKEQVIKLAKHPLISGSAIVFIGGNMANVMNLLFNLFMVRYLSDADYGTLSSLTSLSLLPLLVATALAPVVISFAAEFFAKGELEMVHGLYIKIAKYYFSFSTILLVAFLVCLPLLSSFFRIKDIHLLIVTGIITFIGLVTTLNSAFLQAKLDFLFISVNTFISAAIRLVGGIILVFIGFGVAGGIWAYLFSTVGLFILSFFPLRFLFKRKVKSSPIPTKDLLSYGIPSAVAVFGFTAYISTDIFLTKHFFLPAQAGIYAELALIAKIIYFLTTAIPTVMFPIIVQKRSKGEGYLSTLLIGLLLVALPSIFITILYFIIPNFIIGVFKKPSVLSQSSLLGPFGISMSLYSLVGLLTNFYLSMKKTFVAIPIIAMAIIQGVGIWLFHSSSLEVILVTLFSLLLLLLCLLLYLPYATRR